MSIHPGDPEAAIESIVDQASLVPVNQRWRVLMDAAARVCPDGAMTDLAKAWTAMEWQARTNCNDHAAMADWFYEISIKADAVSSYAYVESDREEAHLHDRSDDTAYQLEAGK